MAERPTWPLDSGVASNMAPPAPPLRTFTFRNFSGISTVTAADVEFTHTHVVFRGASGEIVLAEPAEKVLHLRESRDTDGD